MCNSKKCSKCLELKKLSDFNKNKNKKDGLSSLCKLCHKDYRRNHYLNNKEKVITQVKTWNDKNFSEIELLEKFGDIIYLDGFSKKANRVHETKCIECEKSLARRKEDIEQGIQFICNECKSNPIKSYIKKQIRNTKRRAEIKDLVFNLDYSSLLEYYKKNEFKCEVLKVPFNFTSDEKNIKQPSLDRKDSNKGYTMDNIQVVCLGYNYMKNTFDLKSVNDFIRLLKINTE